MEVVLVNYVVWLSHVIYLTQYICAQDIAHITGRHRCKYTKKSSYFKKLSLLLLLLNVNRPKAFLLGRLTSVQSFQQPPSDRFLHILMQSCLDDFFHDSCGGGFQRVEPPGIVPLMFRARYSCFIFYFFLNFVFLFRCEESCLYQRQ